MIPVQSAQSAISAMARRLERRPRVSTNFSPNPSADPVYRARSRHCPRPLCRVAAGFAGCCDLLRRQGKPGHRDRRCAGGARRQFRSRKPRRARHLSRLRKPGRAALLWQHDKARARYCRSLVERGRPVCLRQRRGTRQAGRPVRASSAAYWSRTRVRNGR